MANLQVLEDALTEYRGPRPKYRLNLVAVVGDQESDDLWALEYLLGQMVSKKDMPVYYAAGSPDGPEMFESGMTKQFMLAAKDNLKFVPWPDVDCNKIQCESQHKELRLPAFDVKLKLNQQNQHYNFSKKVVFVGARLTQQCINRLNDVLKALKPDYLILSGNRFNVQDWGHEGDSYTNRMNLAIKAIKFNGTIVAANMATPPDVTSRFHDYTNESIIGGQPIAPTASEKNSIGTAFDSLNSKKSEFGRQLDEIKQIKLPITTTVVKNKDWAKPVSITGSDGWDSMLHGETGKYEAVGYAQQLVENRDAKAIQSHFSAHFNKGYTEKDNWHQRLHSALSSYAQPFYSGVVSDLANAVLGLHKVQELTGTLTS